MNNGLTIPETALKDKERLKINVLGEKYSIVVTNRRDEPKLSEASGLCDDSIKKIIVDDYSDRHNLTAKEDLTEEIKRTLRHEIVHAFLCESGLACSSEWAMNEEIVDWIALQGPKLYKAWQEAGAV
ncbi:basic secretory protein-like protein [Bacteroides congonensis]|uniref:basic secretory protein-like protein n=1 Tax=Bacteroides congonensis TaxID=1871006 RepID=UPI00265ED80B|nr:basic secretory protein-like protein [Bacteroides congonensis]